MPNDWMSWDARSDDEVDWSLAECRNHPPTREYDPWYPVSAADRGASKLGSAKQRQAEQRDAQDICLSCPILQACGAYAIAHGEQWGTWGSMTDSVRRSLMKSPRRRSR